MKIRCNYCMAIYDEDGMVFDPNAPTIPEGEYCPVCGRRGALMDMGGERMGRLTKDQIYDLLREKGPLTTVEVRDYVYADDDRYSKQDPNVKVVYCYNCLIKLQRDNLVTGQTIWRGGMHHRVWEVMA